MKHKFKLQETNCPEIEVEQSLWLGKTKVLVNGKEIARLSERGKPFPIPMTDGSVKKMFVKSGGFDYVPKVIVDGEEFRLARKLHWYEYTLGFLPLLLLLYGGAIGGALGAVGALLNIRIFRTDWPMVIKVLSVFGITLLTAIAFLIGTNIIRTLIGT